MFFMNKKQAKMQEATVIKMDRRCQHDKNFTGYGFRMIGPLPKGVRGVAMTQHFLPK